jgi:hypothetical protein
MLLVPLARRVNAALDFDAPCTHKTALTPHHTPLAAHVHPRRRSTPTTRLRCCSLPTCRTCGAVACDWPPTFCLFQAQAMGSGLVQMCVCLALDYAPEPPSRRINAALDILSACADVRWPHSARHSLVSSVPSRLPLAPGLGASATPKHRSRPHPQTPCSAFCVARDPRFGIAGFASGYDQRIGPHLAQQGCGRRVYEE